MRYAVFSDIHSNLQALQSVTRRMDELQIDRRICLGDLVGYGANPNECVERVRRMAQVVIAGNHDHAAVDLTDARYFNAHAQAAVLWTRDVLTEENREFLAGLPLVVEEQPMFLVHGSPHEPEQWHYVLGQDAAELNFEYFREVLCLIGHSHRPWAAAKRDGESCKIQVLSELRLARKTRYILNVGSVGQPRDHDARACFLVYDDERAVATIERVEYDIDAARESILKAGLPPALAERLEHGI